MIWGTQRGAAARRTMLLDRPQSLFTLIALVITLIVTSAVVIVLRIPVVSLGAELQAAGSVRLFDGATVLTVAAETPVRFATQRNEFVAVLRADMIPNVAESRGTPEENRLYQRQRDEVAVALGKGRLVATAAGRRLVVVARPRTLGDVGLNSWLPLISGALVLLAGLWIWVLRPADWAPAMFAVSGVGFFTGCLTLVWLAGAGLSLSGTADRLLVAANYTGAFLFVGALAGIFARFPAPLIGWNAIRVAAVLLLLPPILIFVDAIPDAIGSAIVVTVGACVVLLALIAAQYWRSRADPVKRGALAPLALGTASATALYCVLSIVPQIAGSPSIVDPDTATPLLLPIYLGLGLSVQRTKAFDLGRWAIGTLSSAAAVLVFLLTDLIILGLFTRERDVAILLSAMAFAAAYVPVREWVLRRAERAREAKMNLLLQLASDFAFARTSEALQQRWHVSVEALFQPLEILSAEMAGAEPAVLEHGQVLFLPAIGAAQPLLLRYAARGTRVFTSQDLHAAQQFGDLVQTLIDARDSYVRGVAEERERIARDLHDDVSARLLTSLHRSDQHTMRDDVRSAMADIRTIVTGLAGASCALDTLLADLRYESQLRLDAAGIMLVWPMTPVCQDPLPLDYATYRHIISVVRECVTNIMRHAQAATATVRVELIADALKISIGDDGRGFDRTRQRGNGLNNIARRVSELGGSFDIQSDANGSRLTLRVPLPGTGDGSKLATSLATAS